MSPIIGGSLSLPAPSFTSPSQRHPEQILITRKILQGGGDNGTWFLSLKGKRVRQLEVRKERPSSSLCRHEFLVAYTSDEDVYRFDRRIFRTPEVTAKDVWDGCPAEDSITPVTPKELQELEQKSDVAELVHFRSTLPSLWHIILCSVFLHENPSTKEYSVRRYNCFVFARSILCCVATQVAQSIPVQAGNEGARSAHYVKVANFCLLSMVKNGYYSEFDPSKPRIHSF